MAPDEAQRPDDTGADPAPTDDDAPLVPSIDPEGFVQPAPLTNGGEPAPPESFGIAGDPEAAAQTAARTADPRGEEAPESEPLEEPSG